MNVLTDIPLLYEGEQVVDITAQSSVGIGWTYNGSIFTAPILRKNRYTLSQFIDILTEDELGVLLELVNQLPGSVTLTGSVSSTKAHHRKAKRTWEWWRASNNVDFEDSRTVGAVTWLVQNTDEWTPSRATLIAG